MFSDATSARARSIRAFATAQSVCSLVIAGFISTKGRIVCGKWTASWKLLGTGGFLFSLSSFHIAYFALYPPRPPRYHGVEPCPSPLPCHSPGLIHHIGCKFSCILLRFVKLERVSALCVAGLNRLPSPMPVKVNGRRHIGRIGAAQGLSATLARMCIGYNSPALSDQKPFAGAELSLNLP